MATTECSGAEWVGAKERERKIRVRVCVGKEMMTWQTLVDYFSEWRIATWRNLVD